MNVLLIVLGAGILFILAGRFYGRFIAGQVGEDPNRTTPAVAKNDGRDYVPTPTPVVFAHHFASIAGAGPIIGPVIAIIYGWGPALAWVVCGGIFLGAVHDYLATHMAVREGGQSLAVVARRHLGKDAFIALTLFLVLVLVLVCAMFLNLSANALASIVPLDRLHLPEGQTLFDTVTVDQFGKPAEMVKIGGIASMSVIIITAVAPLLGWLYIRRKVSVWKCSALAIAICAVSIVLGLFFPVRVEETTWKLLLAGYVLIAAGVPVWIFLQSRDFINVHILYIGMAVLVMALIVGGLRHPSAGNEAGGIPFLNVAEGTAAMGIIWPVLFITIACGAVSGFHSLCAGGTTCKQLTSEQSVRRVGYNAMLLESFLAVCVIAILMFGAARAGYLADVHPTYLIKADQATAAANGLPVPADASVKPDAGMLAKIKANPVLGFAMPVGHALAGAFGFPIAVGVIAGMLLLEGFLVTTLDTAVRLTRYLIEEIWKTLFAGYDVFAETAAPPEGESDYQPAGAGGIPAAPPDGVVARSAASARPTSGAFRTILLVLRMYWFNSGLAVALTLLFALTGGVLALWGVFAASNQLLAAFGLSIATIWLMRKGRRYWFALIPAVFMLITTITSLVMMLQKFMATPGKHVTLLVADATIMLITAYLLFAAFRTFLSVVRTRRAPAAATGD